MGSKTMPLYVTMQAENAVPRLLHYVLCSWDHKSLPFPAFDKITPDNLPIGSNKLQEAFRNTDCYVMAHLR